MLRTQLTDGVHGLKIQAGIAIALLTVLVGLAIRAEIRLANVSSDLAATDENQQQREFSVTPIAQGQYVMRANDKIFYCLSNKCTGIQLVAVPQSAESQQAPSAPPNSDKSQ